MLLGGLPELRSASVWPTVRTRFVSAYRRLWVANGYRRADLGVRFDALPTMSKFGGTQDELKNSLGGVGDLIVNRNRCHVAGCKLIRDRCDAV